MSAIPFAKGEALGNDYFVVEAGMIPSAARPGGSGSGGDAPGDEAPGGPGSGDEAPGGRASDDAASGGPERALSLEACRAMCDRHRGAGSDGVLVVWPELRPVRLRIYNPDGSEAEKSGNGLRIAAAWLHQHGHVRTGEWFEVELATDTVRMVVHGESDGVRDVTVEMGRARFLADEAGESLDVDGERVVVHAVSLGNPHCVVVEERLDRSRFDRIGPRLERHPRFPAGTNVQFAAARDRSSVDMLIHERGVGETSASGSSSCAVAAVAVRLGIVEGPEVTLHMPGGTLDVVVAPDFALRLRGPARLVYEGKFLAGGW